MFSRTKTLALLFDEDSAEVEANKDRNQMTVKEQEQSRVALRELLAETPIEKHPWVITTWHAAIKWADENLE